MKDKKSTNDSNDFTPQLQAYADRIVKEHPTLSADEQAQMMESYRAALKVGRAKKKRAKMI